MVQLVGKSDLRGSCGVRGVKRKKKRTARRVRIREVVLRRDAKEMAMAMTMPWTDEVYNKCFV